MSSAINLESIRPSRRRDLEVVCRQEADWSDDAEWIVKDPIQLNYFFFDRIQHWLFERLDGSASLKETQREFGKAFSGSNISEKQLLNFCARLSRDGLLIEPLSGEKLKQRNRQRESFSLRRLYKLPLSLLSIRLPGFNAGSIISTADSLCGWIFSPLAVFMAIIWFGLTAVFGIQLLDDIVWELPKLGAIQMQDVLLLLACISGVKIIHELAHAVCCRRMGAHCNEIGMMFLVFSPCLYCNVTDSWMLPDKWKRIAISLAGIYVELIIASVSLFLWHYAETEFLRSLFLNLMIVCSVSTLLINGNPLMRYDGYFVLSDLSGVPNLSQQARSTAWDWLAKVLFIPRQSLNQTTKRQLTIFLIGYYLASIAYRTLILYFIFFVFYSLLEPIGLQNVAVSLGVVYASCLFASFMLAAAPMIKNKNQRDQKNWVGIVAISLILVAAGYFIAKIKVANIANSTAVIEFNDATPCVAKTRGILSWSLPVGEEVSQGDVIARLRNFDSELSRTRLNNEIELSKLRIENLKARSSYDPNSRMAIPSTEAELLELSNQLTMLNEDQFELEIVAPQSGIIIESRKPISSDQAPDKLSSWTGSALSQSNQNCTVEEGETICVISAANNWKAILLIDERKMDLVSAGKTVELRTSLERNKTYGATITSVSNQPIDSQDLLGRKYRAELELDQPLEIGFHGATAKANVLVDRQTIWQIAKRFATESFNFGL